MWQFPRPEEERDLLPALTSPIHALPPFSSCPNSHGLWSLGKWAMPSCPTLPHPYPPSPAPPPTHYPHPKDPGTTSVAPPRAPPPPLHLGPRGCLLGQGNRGSRPCSNPV